VKDSIAVKSECASARNLGFFGKAAIHPSQIAEINIGFRPTEAEIAHAKRVVALCGDGVITIDGKMVDMAMLRSARRIALQT
jgi:citrate lyase beta subunit